MAIKLGDALLELSADDKQLKKDLDGAEQKTRGWGATMTGVLQGFGIGLFGAITDSIRGAWDGITESIGMASDLSETISKVETLFGDSAAGILEWSSTAAGAMGMTQEAALDHLGTIGNTFLQLGQDIDTAGQQSQTLVQLAADLGSFHNADPTEILEGMSAAFRGEYDALQRYVPMINAANVEQRALADTGKASAKELTALDKATAAYALTIEGAGAATGDFARTSDSWSNSMKTLNSYWAEFKTLIGETLLPVLEPLLNKVKELASEWLPKLSDYIRANVIPAMEDWAANFDTWWADHGQPFIDSIYQMWDDIVAKTAEALGVSKDDFEVNLDSLLTLARVVGAEIGQTLGENIGAGLQSWWDSSFESWWDYHFGSGLQQRWNDQWFNNLGHTPQVGPSAGGGGGGGFGAQSIPSGLSAQSMPQAVTINNYVDATTRSTAEAARDGTLDALRQAGMR